MKMSIEYRLVISRVTLLTLLMCSFSGIYAQDKQSVTGKLMDLKSNQPVPFVNVALIREIDSALVSGSMSDENGKFNIGNISSGHYSLRATFIGYEPSSKRIEVVNEGVTDAGTIYMQDTYIMLNETEVVTDRLKAKAEMDKTTFFMTKKMVDASATGIDVLKLIPGVGVDMMHNVSLEGSKNILIYVNGRERDKGYVSQLKPGQVERVEIINVPSSSHDGDITGAINIILKKDQETGFEGQVYAEIPTSGSEVFAFPTYSFNYGFKNLNLFTSYNGELTYLNLHESTERKAWIDSDTIAIYSNQNVRQKDWSHKFHYGFDYFLSPNDVINFYAFYNPFSRELDGTTETETSGILNDGLVKARKEDTDVNSRSSYSLYYKHNFTKPGRELSLDITTFQLKGENSTDYIYEGSVQNSITTNSVNPRQNATSIKIDFTSPIGSKLNFSTGIKSKFQVLRDRNVKGFNYSEDIMAAYGTFAYKQKKYDMSLGLRAERSGSHLEDNFSNNLLALLPYAIFNYKVTSFQKVQFSYNRSVSRPNIYQLNPYTSMDDPYSMSQGNPSLKPELRSNISIEHSIQFKSNYVATRLFYKRSDDMIDNLVVLADTGTFLSRVHNLGTMHKYGIQFSGSVKLGNATLNPFVQLYNQYSVGNEIAEQNGIENRQQLGFNSGLSAILSFKNNLALSLTFQYASEENIMQGTSYCDALYFVSVDKTFKNKIKVGVVSGIPFTKSFTYKGSNIEASNFTMNYQGNVNMSTIPLWFKVGYQFGSGNNRKRVDRVKEEVDVLPKKGF